MVNRCQSVVAVNPSGGSRGTSPVPGGVTLMQFQQLLRRSRMRPEPEVNDLPARLNDTSADVVDKAEVLLARIDEVLD